jgi:hypothetical protein
MSQIPSAMSISSPSGTHLPRDGAKRRREHLRHIHRVTHDQQIALIEEARASRLREQDQNQETSKEPICNCRLLER